MTRTSSRARRALAAAVLGIAAQSLATFCGVALAPPAAGFVGLPQRVQPNARVHRLAAVPVSTDNTPGGIARASTARTSPKSRNAHSIRLVDDDRRIRLVILGLIVVAALLGLLTGWYWVRTRPSRVVAAIGAPVAHRQPGDQHV